MITFYRFLVNGIPMRTRSIITSVLKRHTLFRGLALGILGLIPLFFGGIFLPVQELNRWGLPLFFLSFGLITWGLLPYRRLSRLETHPNELIISPGPGGEEVLLYLNQGKVEWSIPLTSVKKVDFLQDGVEYGLCIHLPDGELLNVPYFNQQAIAMINYTPD